MESLQLSQVLADLSNLGAAVCISLNSAFLTKTKHEEMCCVLFVTWLVLTVALQEPDAAAAIVQANIPIIKTNNVTSEPSNNSQSQRPSAVRRTWSADPGSQPKFDKFGRRILVSSAGSWSGSANNSTPGTPRRGDSDVSIGIEV